VPAHYRSAVASSVSGLAHANPFQLSPFGGGRQDGRSGTSDHPRPRGCGAVARQRPPGERGGIDTIDRGSQFITASISCGGSRPDGPRVGSPRANRGAATASAPNGRPHHCATMAANCRCFRSPFAQQVCWSHRGQVQPGSARLANCRIEQRGQKQCVPAGRDGPAPPVRRRRRCASGRRCLPGIRPCRGNRVDSAVSAACFGPEVAGRTAPPTAPAGRGEAPRPAAPRLDRGRHVFEMAGSARGIGRDDLQLCDTAPEISFGANRVAPRRTADAEQHDPLASVTAPHRRSSWQLPRRATAASPCTATPHARVGPRKPSSAYRTMGGGRGGGQRRPAGAAGRGKGGGGGGGGGGGWGGVGGGGGRGPPKDRRLARMAILTLLILPHPIPVTLFPPRSPRAATLASAWVDAPCPSPPVTAPGQPFLPPPCHHCPLPACRHRPPPHAEHHPVHAIHSTAATSTESHRVRG